MKFDNTYQDLLFKTIYILKSKVRVVSGFTELLKKTAADRLTEGELEYLDFIKTSSQQMQAIIKDANDYVFIDSEAVSIEAISLKPFLKTVVAHLKTPISEGQAIIEYDKIPETIYGNRDNLQQLFRELISNSVIYSRPDVLPVISICAHELEHYWQFEINDNGIGISPRYHEGIFLIFSRLHNGDTYEGRGLGLAICKKIVEAHQGKIWLESEVGKGSTFYFTLRKSLGTKSAENSTTPDDTP